MAFDRVRTKLKAKLKLFSFSDLLTHIFYSLHYPVSSAYHVFMVGGIIGGWAKRHVCAPFFSCMQDWGLWREIKVFFLYWMRALCMRRNWKLSRFSSILTPNFEGFLMSLASLCKHSLSCFQCWRNNWEKSNRFAHKDRRHRNETCLEWFWLGLGLGKHRDAGK